MNPRTTILGVPRSSSTSVLTDAVFSETEALVASLLALNGTAAESAPVFSGRNISLGSLTAAAGLVARGNCTCTCARPLRMLRKAPMLLPGVTLLACRGLAVSRPSLSSPSGDARAVYGFFLLTFFPHLISLPHPQALGVHPSGAPPAPCPD